MKYCILLNGAGFGELTLPIYFVSYASTRVSHIAFVPWYNVAMGMNVWLTGWRPPSKGQPLIFNYQFLCQLTRFNFPCS